MPKSSSSKKKTNNNKKKEVIDTSMMTRSSLSVDRASSIQQQQNQRHHPLSDVLRRFSSSPQLLLRFIILMPIIYLWNEHSSAEVKSQSLALALSFMIIETTFTSLTADTEDGRVIFSPHVGHTTWAQFFSNIFYLPVFLYLRKLILVDGILPNVNANEMVTDGLRIIFCPLNVWLLEIIEGYFLIFLFGRNIAWSYTSPDAYFHGNIRLKYFFAWIGMGCLLEFFWSILFVPVSEKLMVVMMNNMNYNSDGNGSMCSMCSICLLVGIVLPTVFLTDRFVGWPKLGV